MTKLAAPGPDTTGSARRAGPAEKVEIAYMKSGYSFDFNILTPITRVLRRAAPGSGAASAPRSAAAPARLAAVAGLVLLAGCAERGLPLGPPVTVPAPAGAQGQAQVVIRAFLPGPGGDRREVGGAICEVSSILFRTRAVTPAKVVFPSYGAQSPTLQVDCAAGAARGQAVQPVRTEWVSPPGAGPWGPGPWGGPWGPGWGGAWGPGPWGWNGPSYPVFIYPDVSVVLHGPVDTPPGLGQSSPKD